MEMSETLYTRYNMVFLKNRGRSGSTTIMASNGHMTWHTEAVMEKRHYQHFTRVPNRQKYHKMSTLAGLGYALVKIPPSNIFWRSDVNAWLQENVQNSAWVNVHTSYVFAYEQDAFLFKLAWG
tara:strand:+ start:868 stop:1236 length:369 start_codon:yes stop_codon:yes gene_type:complete